MPFLIDPKHVDCELPIDRYAVVEEGGVVVESGAFIHPAMPLCPYLECSSSALEASG